MNMHEASCLREDLFLSLKLAGGWALGVLSARVTGTQEAMPSCFGGLGRVNFRSLCLQRTLCLPLEPSPQAPPFYF